MAYNIYSSSNKEILTTVNLIAAYDTYAKGTHEGVFTKEKRDYYGCVHMIEGEGYYYFKDKAHFLTPNSLLFGTHKEIEGHKMTSPSWNKHVYWFNLYNEHLPLNTIFSIAPNAIEKEYTHKIVEHLNMATNYDIAIANSYFNIILNGWLKEINALQNINMPYYNLMQNAIFFINNNLTKSISVASLAEEFGFSEYYFRKLFKDYVGSTPKAYINKKKMERSVDLLKTTSMTVSDISEYLNYSSPFHFISSFKDEYGISPLKYKQNNINQ